MGIAKWRMQNSKNSDDDNENRKLSQVPSKFEDDMEIIYPHVRYQRSFDAEDRKKKEERYQEMKNSRKMMLKPLKSMGIKKFSKQYAEIRNTLIQKKRKERLLSNKHSEYKPPKYTKMAKSLIQEEADKKQRDEIKRKERLDSNKKRDKYWLLVRDLHPPKVSEMK